MTVPVSVSSRLSSFAIRSIIRHACVLPPMSVPGLARPDLTTKAVLPAQSGCGSPRPRGLPATDAKFDWPIVDVAGDVEMAVGQVKLRLDQRNACRRVQSTVRHHGKAKRIDMEHDTATRPVLIFGPQQGSAQIAGTQPRRAARLDRLPEVIVTSRVAKGAAVGFSL